MGKSPRTRKKGNHVLPFLRFRSIGNDAIFGEQYVWHSSQYVDGSHWDGADIGQNSVMADNLADHYEFGERPVMGVDHLKVVKSFGPRTVATFHDWFPFIGRTEWTFLRDGCFWQGPGIHDVDVFAPLPSRTVIRDHSLKAFKEMLQQFPAEISLPNTLMELKEIPRLFDTVKDVDDFLRGLGRDRGGESIRKAANLYAAENFGVDPLIGDITTAFKLRDIVARRLAHLRRNRGKWARAGSLTRLTVDADVHFAHMEAALDEKVRLVRTKSEYEIRSTCRIQNDLSWVNEWEGWIRGFMATTGWNNPASVLWEATPFSWAVDYLLPIGDYLETLGFQQIEGWLIKRLCTTVVGTHTISVEIHPRHGIWRKLGDFKIRRYTRAIGLPEMSWGIGVPTTKQTSLLAAVAIGRNK